MQQVGNHLADVAILSTDTVEIDLFGRSAVNRYYYACFLETRRAVTLIHPTLEIKHKQLPQNLRSTIARIVRAEIGRAEKARLISSLDAGSSRVLLNRVVSELAEVLEKSYKLRVIADYQPELRVVRQAGHLVLDGNSSTDIRDWYRRVARNVARITKLWKDLGHA